MTQFTVPGYKLSIANMLNEISMNSKLNGRQYCISLLVRLLTWDKFVNRTIFFPLYNILSCGKCSYSGCYNKNVEFAQLDLQVSDCEALSTCLYKGFWDKLFQSIDGITLRRVIPNINCV